MPIDAPLDLATMSMTEVVRALKEQRLPPVEKWNPTHCGDSEMRIARDGSWYHQGTLIGRPEMVRLFSTILRREPDGRFVLVTPGEKLDIAVDDAPFLAVEVQSDGTGADRCLAFRLNTGDFVVAGPINRLCFAVGEDGPHPRLSVRSGLDALIARPVYYELVEMALSDQTDPPGVWSQGAFFAMTA